MLSASIAFKWLKSVSRRNSQIVEPFGTVDQTELGQCSVCDLDGEMPATEA
jgi:hypothetical protein